MDSTGGTLHFDINANNKKYFASLLSAENRTDLFVSNVLKSTSTIDSAFLRLGSNLTNLKAPDLDFSSTEAGINESIDAISRLSSATFKMSDEERRASLVLQNALLQERVEREKILIQIARNNLEQQNANALAKEQAAIQKGISDQQRKDKTEFATSYEPSFQAPEKLGNSGDPTRLLLKLLNEEYKAGKINVKDYNDESQRLTAIIAENDRLFAVEAALLKDNTNSTLQNTQSKRDKAAALKEAAVAEQLAIMKEQDEANAVKQTAREMNAAKGSIDQRKLALDRLTAAYYALSAGERETAAGIRLGNIVQGVSTQVKGLEDQLKTTNTTVKTTGGVFGDLKSQLEGIATSYLSLYAAIGAIKAVAHSNAELSDSMSDVKRTAKESTEEVGQLVDTLKGVDTRSSLSNLLDIGFIGGQLAVSKKDLVGYIETVDQLAVVLKREFPGGADAVARSLGKIISIYKLTSKENITLEESLRKVGSAFLGLAHDGPVNVQYLQDFTLRTAGAAQVAKLSLPTMLAYGAVLSQAGVSVQIAASSTTRLISSLSGKKEKYFAIAQLADSTLTIEKFTKLINTDTKAALDLFFKGLASGNPVQTEFNARIGTLGFKVGAATNAVTALALNQADLTRKVDIGNQSYQDASLSTENFTEKNNNLAASFDKLGNSISNIATSPDSALGKLFKYIIDSITDGTKALTGFLNFIGKFKDIKVYNPFDIDNNRKAAAEAGKIFEEQLRKNKAAANRDAIEGVATLKVKTIVDTNIDEPALKKAIQVQQDKLDRLYDQSNYAKAFAQNPKNSSEQIAPFIDKFKKLQAPLYQQQLIVDKLKNSYKGLYGAVQQSFDDGGGERTIDVIKQDIKDTLALQAPLGTQTKKFKEYADRLKELRAELKVAKGGTISTRDPVDSELNKRNNLQKKIDELTRGSLITQKTADEQEIAGVIEKYKKIELEIDKFYADQKKSKNSKGYKLTISGLSAAEERELAIVRYNQEAKLQLQSLDKQREQYVEYENFLNEFGQQMADQRFSNEVDTSVTYLQKLQKTRDQVLQTAPENRTGAQNQYAKELTDRIVAEEKVQTERNKTALLDARSLEENIIGIKARYAKIATDLGKDATNSRKQSLLQQRDDAINAARDEALQKTAIYRKLSQDAVEYTKKETEDKIKDLQKLLDAGQIPNDLVPKIQKQLEGLQQGLKATVKLGIDQSDLNKLKVQYKDLITELSQTDDKGNTLISDDEFTRINKAIDVILEKMKLLDPNKDGKATYGDKIYKNFEYLKGSATDIANGVSNDLGRVSSSFSELSTALGGTDTQAGYLVDSFAKLAQIGADAAGAFASFSTGDIIGGVTKTISAVSGVLSLGKKVRDMNAKARAEVQKYYDDVLAGETAYATLLRDRERQLLKLNAIGISGIDKETDGLKKQQAQVQKDFDAKLKQLQSQDQGQVTGSTYKHGTLFRKATTTYQYAGLQGLDYDALEKLYTSNKLTDGAKALFEELQKLKQEGQDVDQALKDAAQAADELATGTTVDNLSSNIISSLKAGKNQLKDVMDDYTKIIQDALLSTFKSDVVDVEMKKFYERLSALAQSNGELTPEEIQTAQDDYIAVRKRIQDQFDALSKISGIDLKDNPDTAPAGISGEVRSLSQDTGSAIEGLMRGIYDISKRNGDLNLQNAVTLSKQLEYTAQIIGLQVEIRDYTKTSASNSQIQIDQMGIMITKLASIVTNTIPVSARDKGLGGL